HRGAVRSRSDRDPLPAVLLDSPPPSAYCLLCGNLPPLRTQTMTTPLTRRSFLKASATAAAGVAAFGVPAVNVLGAHDELRVGLIGTAGRCQALMKALANIPNVRMVAVCDVWDVHLDQGRKLADPKAFATKNYHEVLARKDVDAVVIGAPDHWHVPMTVD